jgi:hypothetical protein
MCNNNPLVRLSPLIAALFVWHIPIWGGSVEHFEAKISFNIEVLREDPHIKTSLFKELDRLEAGDKEAVYVHGVPVFGEKKLKSYDEHGSVTIHNMYIYMHKKYSHEPFWLRGKKYQSKSSTELDTDPGVDVRIHSTSVVSGSPSFEVTIVTDSWSKHRSVIDCVDDLLAMHNRACENCGQPLVDATGKPIRDTRVTKCLWHCPSNQLVLEQA